MVLAEPLPLDLSLLINLLFTLTHDSRNMERVTFVSSPFYCSIEFLTVGLFSLSEELGEARCPVTNTFTAKTGC